MTFPAKSKDDADENNNNNRSSTPNLRAIALAPGQTLVSWKVAHGSPVRRGETVALVMTTTTAAAAASSSDKNNNSAVAVATVPVPVPITVAPSHKRPTRRKRPSAAAAAVAQNHPSAQSLAPSDSIPSTSSTTSTDNDDSGNKNSNIKGSTSSTGSTAQHTPIVAHVDGILRILSSQEQATADRSINADSSSSSTNTKTVIVGVIDECPHPTVVAGLCAVCGSAPARTVPTSLNDPILNGAGVTDTESANDRSDTNDTNAKNSTMARMTVAGGVTVQVSHDEARSMAQQSASRLRTARKLSLVLDLDHTLVHATADPRAEQSLMERSDVRSLVLPITVTKSNNKNSPQSQKSSQQQPVSMVCWQRHYVKLRPHVRDFLETASETYELGVYTAGTRDYAEQIVLLLARHLVQARYKENNSSENTNLNDDDSGSEVRCLDQVDLERLRQQVHQAQQLLDKQEALKQQQPAAASSSSFDEPDSDKGTTTTKPSYDDSNDTAPTDPATAVTAARPPTTTDDSVSDPEEKKDTEGFNNDIDDKATAPTTKKRKRVTFGAVPASTPTDLITLDDVTSLRAALAQADRLEAEAIALRQRLFGSRVVSRTDVGDLGRDVKSLQRIFPCGGQMAAVVDDREDVWANAADWTARPGEPPENLLLVRPYHWDSFVGFADINNCSGVDFGRSSAVRSEQDEQLMWTGDILRRLHARYYDKTNSDATGWPSVPTLLSEMRREVLSGCRVVLSGLIPLHKQQRHTADGTAATNNTVPPRAPFVRFTENLGATLQATVNEHVTHVVAAKDGTDKIVTARTINLQRRRQGKDGDVGMSIVKVTWLMDCAWSMTRRVEGRYVLGESFGSGNSSTTGNGDTPLLERALSSNLPTATAPAPPVTNESRSDGSSSSSEEDDDDDFAADLENEMMGEDA